MSEQFAAKPFYSPAEVAAILGVSDSYITGRIAKGEIEAVRLSPRVIRISYGSLMALIGRALPVRHGALTPEEIERERVELKDEPVPAPGRLLVER